MLLVVAPHSLSFCDPLIVFGLVRRRGVPELVCSKCYQSEGCDSEPDHVTKLHEWS
jgi:hypothetical protein